MNFSIRARSLLGTLAVVAIVMLGLSIPLVMAVREIAFTRIEERLESNAMQGATLLLDALQTGDVAAATEMAGRIAAGTETQTSGSSRLARVFVNTMFA